MNDLQIFKNAEFGEIRTVEIEGKPYFVGNDIAKALGYVKPQNAISVHCRGALKQGIGVQTGIKADGNPAMQTIEMLVIPEGDVYRLTVCSKLPQAEKFEAWVFDEVLPSIRQNRGYILGQENMTDDELLANAVLVAQRKIAERDKVIRAQDKKIEEMKPKAIFADAVSTSHTSILIGDLAKLICQNGVQIGQKRLFEWLRNNGYLVKSGSSKNMPVQRYIEQGLFEVKESSIQNPDGSVRITRTTKISGKGQVYFVNKFLNKKR